MDPVATATVVAVAVESGPSAWNINDWVIALGTILGSLTAFYLTVGRPLLQQLKELIVALKSNTAATDVSAAAMSTTAVAVDANTVVTKQAADALVTSPVTVNVATPPPEPSFGPTA